MDNQELIDGVMSGARDLLATVVVQVYKEMVERFGVPQNPDTLRGACGMTVMENMSDHASKHDANEPCECIKETYTHIFYKAAELLGMEVPTTL